MQICFTSYRAFPDGPVRQPFAESDPANIVYALGGTYISFYTLKRLSDRQLEEALRPFDLVIVALDVEAIELVRRIVDVCRGRAATYSEGHLADYQRLSPSGQVSFLHAIRASSINFLYWEKYVPFFRALTDAPVKYLPYPYLLDEARRHYLPIDQRPLLAALPTGLAGYTRNGLATLAVARRLLDEELLEELVLWLERESFDEDARAVEHFLFSVPFAPPPRRLRLNWRKWLLSSRLDYRPLLRLKARIESSRPNPSPASPLRTRNARLLPRRGWTDYVAQLAPARILIDLNNRETVGRNALDCAALGIACVSTNRSDMQARLFPQTTLDDSWDIAGAVDVCRRLLSDIDFRQEVVAHAAEAVGQFDTDGFIRRFRSMAEHSPPLSGTR